MLPDDGVLLRFIPACAGNSYSKSPGAPFITGSSPRVRGTPRQFVQPLGQHRFIPACAGNSLHGTRKGCRPPVHPRVCGELPFQQSHRRRGRRFIPACAGNSFLDHRGTGRVAGSSPRVRGTRVRRTGGRGQCRFIPACAGNSGPGPKSAGCPAVHPRVCGELVILPFLLKCARRFIPACAGNSGSDAISTPTGTVHPRVCGELSIGGAVRHSRAGSSPRVRGTRLEGDQREKAGRFIPACAGNSRCGRSAPRRSPVHPRVCGELLLRSTW